MSTSIVFGTSPGTKAYDAAEALGNPFATALIATAATPDKPLLAHLSDVRRNTLAATGGRQRPVWHDLSHVRKWKLCTTFDNTSEVRIALLLMVSDYRTSGLGFLPGVLHDQLRLAAWLGSQGYSVLQGQHPDRSSLLRSLALLKRMSRNADAALIYCTGHGVMWGQETYLLPATYPARTPDSEAKLVRRALSVTHIATFLQAGAVNVMFFAGCRTRVDA